MRGCNERAGMSMSCHHGSDGMMGCCCSNRRFMTKAERINWLEDYKKNLQTEIKAVDEVMKEMKK